jgi:hypothetical protein
MKEFMFLYRGGDSTWVTKTSSDEKQAIMALWAAWLEQLGKNGQLVTGGSPLEYGGKRILKKDGVITDIAASEVKELVSGYSIVKAESYEQAVALARGCPIFRTPGAQVEVRAVLAM